MRTLWYFLEKVEGGQARAPPRVYKECHGSATQAERKRDRLGWAGSYAICKGKSEANHRSCATFVITLQSIVLNVHSLIFDIDMQAQWPIKVSNRLQKLNDKSICVPLPNLSTSLQSSNSLHFHDTLF